MTAKTLAAGIAFAAALHDAHAGRPFVTDDARVVDRGHCQLETFYKKQRADSGSEFWVLPACNPALAPFESGIELTVGANRVEGERNLLLQGAVIHANLGAIRSGATWGVGLEALLAAPRLYGILETFGERGEGPTRHIGLRFWVIPNRFQIDATAGRQSSLPERRFNSVGLRLLF